MIDAEFEGKLKWTCRFTSLDLIKYQGELIITRIDLKCHKKL